MPTTVRFFEARRTVHRNTAMQSPKFVATYVAHRFYLDGRNLFREQECASFQELSHQCHRFIQNGFPKGALIGNELLRELPAKFFAIHRRYFAWLRADMVSRLIKCHIMGTIIQRSNVAGG